MMLQEHPPPLMKATSIRCVLLSLAFKPEISNRVKPQSKLFTDEGRLNRRRVQVPCLSREKCGGSSPRQDPPHGIRTVSPVSLAKKVSFRVGRAAEWLSITYYAKIWEISQNIFPCERAGLSTTNSIDYGEGRVLISGAVEWSGTPVAG